MNEFQFVIVVAGWMRSFTSAMMRGLEAGGIECAYRQSRDVMKARYADQFYDPNIGGLYELERADYLHPQFPRMYAGKAIKALRQGVGNMRTVPGGIKVIWMHRDHEEQRQSYMAFFGGTAPTVEQIAYQVQRGLEAAKNRRDTETIEIDGPEFVADPLATFNRVRDFLGVDLDVAAAAAVIDPQLYRYRREELEVGIQ